MVKQVATLALATMISFHSTVAVMEKKAEQPPSEEYRTSEVWLKPTTGSAMKTYQEYKTITDTTSAQYKFLNCRADVKVNEQGFLMEDNEWYCVALGSYFGEIGTKYILTLSTGKELKIVKGEAKADCDTDEDNYLAQDGHIIEFLIDSQSQWMQERVTNNGYIFNGNFNNYIHGDIVKIERVER